MVVGSMSRVVSSIKTTSDDGTFQTCCNLEERYDIELAN